MLIKISLDIWRNIFDCLSPKDRRKLALKFDEIGDREFSDIFQKWLHEWIKNVRIGELQIDSLDGKVPRMQRWDQQEPLFPIAQTLPPDDNLQGFRFFDATLINFAFAARMRQFLRQMQPAIAQLSGGTPQRGCWSPAEVVQFAETECPENIKDFKEIKLRHLDTTVLQFMRHLQPLFRDVCLQVRSYVNNRSAELNNRSAELAALGHLMPLLSGSIHILSLDRQQLLLAIRRQFPAQFLAVKHLDMENQNRITVELIEIFIPWLGTKRADGAPRILTMKPHSFDDRILTLKPLNCADHTLEFIERIRQQFISATEPASFFVCLTHIISPTNTCAPIPESTTQNVITSEQLVVQHRNIRVSTRLLLIGRCSAELDGQQWVEEMREKCQNGWTRMAERAIVIYSLKLGQIEEASLVEGEEEKEDFSQPGPSKKQKLI